MWAVCGGLVRDHDGTVLNGFMLNIGEGTSLHAETWACPYESQWNQVTVETDCLELVELLRNGWDPEHPQVTLLANIQQWLDGEWEVNIEWCCRERNKAAEFSSIMEGAVD